MEQGGRNRAAEKRREILRKGIKDGSVVVTPVVEVNKIIAKVKSETDKGQVELEITDPDEVAHLIGMSEEEKK